MELIERADILATLRRKFERVEMGEGHCILLSGEAGIGKTSVAKAFCGEKRNDCSIYHGTCDALFTPRPLAPVYDIALQMGSDIWENNETVADRARLFTRFFQDLSKQPGTSLIIFEDIHWADEASLDFIKFFARRIAQIHCMFILTYRNDEIHPHHPLRNLLGQLPPDSFTRLQLEPLSRKVVETMAVEKGYSGEDVYSISGGNPFYVNEILASYSPGVPDNIKDSILSVYNRQDEDAKHVWRTLSILPTGFETQYLDKVAPHYIKAAENAIDMKIFVVRDERIFFKHELYRRTIESSMSPLVRLALNKRVLFVFLESFEQNKQIQRIIHHAKNANDYSLVARYAPMAAKQAAALGAHLEASKLYYTAIEYYQDNDKEVLIEFYELYAYECYLTNQVNEAIIYQTKSLALRKTQNNAKKTGDCMRFLSRFWWFGGNHKQAELYGSQAIEVLNNQPPSAAKAMALSNMSQLKMLSNEHSDCVSWGEKAIAMAKELGDETILSHALNNVGSAQMQMLSTEQEGVCLLQQSLHLALKNSHHEHAARAYTNLGSIGVKIKKYAQAKSMLEEGINYCEEQDLASWKAYMLSYQSWLMLDIGRWDEALGIAENLTDNEDQAPIVKIVALSILARIKLRRGDADVFPLLDEAKVKAFETMELQRIIPALGALLEYEWLTGNRVVDQTDIDTVVNMVGPMGNVYENSEFAFWLLKVRKQILPLTECYEGYQANSRVATLKAAAVWERLGCPYERALMLFEGTDADKKEAITIVHELGAGAVYQKMKLEMRASGIKSIPRGKRKSTRANPAYLTDRELSVLDLLKAGMQNKEIATTLFIAAKTVDHHISAILLKLNVNSRGKAVQEAINLGIIK